MSLREVIPSSFVELLDLFGISLRGEKDNTFVLSGEVSPVVLVGSTTQIQAISTPMNMDVPATVGFTAAPAINTVLADTGQLTPGLYAVRAILAGRTTSGAQCAAALQRRDAANAATIWNQEIGVTESAGLLMDISMTARVQLNERIRIITTSAASMSVQANIWTQRLGD